MLAIISLNSPHNVFSNCPLWATERNQPEKMAEGNRFSPPQIDTSSPSSLSDWSQLHQLETDAKKIGLAQDFTIIKNPQFLANPYETKLI